MVVIVQLLQPSCYARRLLHSRGKAFSLIWSDRSCTSRHLRVAAVQPLGVAPSDLVLRSNREFSIPRPDGWFRSTIPRNKHARMSLNLSLEDNFEAGQSPLLAGLFSSERPVRDPQRSRVSCAQAGAGFDLRSPQRHAPAVFPV